MDGILYTPIPGRGYDVLRGFGPFHGPSILSTPVHSGPNMSILMRDGGKDKTSGSSAKGEIKYPNNPKKKKEEYEKVRKSRAQENLGDGSIWEKDLSSHGGEQWKRWRGRKSWERGDKPDSVWPDGRVRKKGDT